MRIFTPPLSWHLPVIQSWAQHSVTTPCNPDFLGGCYVIMFTGLQGVGQSQ